MCDANLLPYCLKTWIPYIIGGSTRAAKRSASKTGGGENHPPPPLLPLSLLSGASGSRFRLEVPCHSLHHHECDCRDPGITEGPSEESRCLSRPLGMILFLRHRKGVGVMLPGSVGRQCACPMNGSVQEDGNEGVDSSQTSWIHHIC